MNLCPMDIYRASDRYFQIIDGKLMPALNTIEGLGGKAAEQLSWRRQKMENSFPKTISDSGRKQRKQRSN